MHCYLPTFVLLSVTVALAQESPGKPVLPLAPDLVRQRVEAGPLKPPNASHGVELAAGVGPMALLVRRADGKFEVQELQRGSDTKVQPAKPKVLEDSPTEDVEPPTVRFTWADGVVSVSGVDATAAPWSSGKELDVAALRPQLTTMLAAAKGSKQAGQLLLDAAPEVPMQHLLTVWSTAHELGYRQVMFRNATHDMRVPEAAHELVTGLATRFSWPVRKAGKNGEMSICDGELLLLVCAQGGFWRLSFVVRKDAETFVKLPADLMVDNGG
jgi:biopolymer transport protein ExbD